MKRTVQQVLQHIPVTIGVCLLLLFGSCRKEEGPIIVPDSSPAPVSYANSIQPIFNTNCVTGCHDAGNLMGNLNLEASSAYTNLVNVPADNYAPTLRVKPSVSDSSVLWHKVKDTGVYGGQMPMAGLLQSFEVDLIKKWINEGAKNN